MKIKIITFHYAHNYGAVLQAYALRTYLRNKGHKVSIANYVNKKDIQKYSGKLTYPHTLKDFRHLRAWSVLVKDNLDTLYSQKQWKMQCKSFEHFINNIILENDTKVISLDDLATQDVECFIAGSDQIWNTSITGGTDKAYFLNFPTKAKKVFYGASNGSTSIPDKIQSYVISTLSEIDNISCREETLAISLSKLLNKKVDTVVDPTLLLNRNDYERLITDNSRNSKKFIFAYFISESDELMKVAEYIARILGVTLIELHYYARRDLKGHHQRADMGPEEFLWHIKNAEFIITNSFHGLVFSIIFQKQFYGIYHKDARKDGLLSKLGLEHRKVHTISQVDLNDRIDFNCVDKSLNTLRKNSEIFLDNIQ